MKLFITLTPSRRDVGGGSEVETHPLPRYSRGARFPNLSSQAGQAHVAHQTSGPRGPGGTRKTWISLKQEVAVN